MDYEEECANHAIDTVSSLKERIEELEAQIENLNEAHRIDNRRLEKALKEQGFEVGPFVEGPDIRD